MYVKPLYNKVQSVPLSLTSLKVGNLPFGHHDGVLLTIIEVLHNISSAVGSGIFFGGLPSGQAERSEKSINGLPVVTANQSRVEQGPIARCPHNGRRAADNHERAAVVRQLGYPETMCYHMVVPG